MTTMTTPANVSDQLMGLYGPEQLREVERLSTYNYRARAGRRRDRAGRGPGRRLPGADRAGDGRMMGYKKVPDGSLKPSGTVDKEVCQP